jgi:hypothetical protein
MVLLGVSRSLEIHHPIDLHAGITRQTVFESNPMSTIIFAILFYRFCDLRLVWPLEIPIRWTVILIWGGTSGRSYPRQVTAQLRHIPPSSEPLPQDRDQAFAAGLLRAEPDLPHYRLNSLIHRVPALPVLAPGPGANFHPTV